MSNWNTTVVANVDVAREAEAQLLESETGNIASAELIEQNARAVNAIYLNTIGQSGEAVEFDAGQAATLLSIAGQCPLLGGNPVYQARSLYSLIDEETDFDDALLCIAEGYVVKSIEQGGSSASVYPNPTRDGQLFFNVTGLAGGHHQGVIRIQNMQGKQVVELSFVGENGSVDVSMLAMGLYQWSITIEGLRIDQGKVTVF